MGDAPKRGYLGPRPVEGFDPAIDRMSDCIDELEAEIERLRAEVERLTNGNNVMGLLWNAERALADQLAEALRRSWELTEATHDEVFGTMVAAHGALAAHKEARRD